MLSSEDLYLGHPECPQCCVAELLTGDLGETETKRPVPVEFRKHETQCRGFFLHGCCTRLA
jgi:hypothetical protein